MSLFIKGMDVPKNGRIIIELASEETGTNVVARITDDKTGKLIEHKGVVVIPTPHGRLIDADRLMEVLKSAIPYEQRTSAVFCMMKNIENAPTIIEKEDE